MHSYVSSQRQGLRRARAGNAIALVVERPAVLCVFEEGQGETIRY